MQTITITVSGPSGSGKTTLALEIVKALEQIGIAVRHPEGQNSPDFFIAHRDDRLDILAKRSFSGVLDVVVEEHTTRRQPSIVNTAP